MSRSIKFVTLMNIARLRETRKAGQQRHHMSRLADAQAAVYDQVLRREHVNIDEDYLKEDAGSVSSKKGSEKVEIKMESWIPHPRTGIYFPEGQEWVMNDVSGNAASLGQSHSYWLRNIHGVEKHDPDVLSADHYFLTQDYHA